MFTGVEARRARRRLICDFSLLRLPPDAERSRVAKLDSPGNGVGGPCIQVIERGYDRIVIGCDIWSRQSKGGSGGPEKTK